LVAQSDGYRLASNGGGAVNTVPQKPSPPLVTHTGARSGTLPGSVIVIEWLPWVGKITLPSPDS
jgi:hypothetical protein